MSPLLEHATFFQIMFGENQLFHNIPGLLFIAGGLVYLFVTLHRERRRSLSESFCSIEKNYVFLTIFSKIILVLIFLSVFHQLFHCFNINTVQEEESSAKEEEEYGLTEDDGDAIEFTTRGSCFLNEVGHIVMYSLYACIGGTVLLESIGKLSVDSWRCAAIFCFLANYILLEGHAQSKKLKEDQLTHHLWSQIELYQAVVMAYSVKNTSCVVSYVASLTMFVIKGLWIITTGTQLSTNFMSLENIRPMFVFQTTAIAMTATLVGAFFGKKSSNSRHYNNNNNNVTDTTTTTTKDYEQLLKVEQEELSTYHGNNHCDIIT